MVTVVSSAQFERDIESNPDNNRWVSDMFSYSCAHSLERRMNDIYSRRIVFHVERNSPGEQFVVVGNRTTGKKVPLTCDENFHNFRELVESGVEWSEWNSSYLSNTAQLCREIAAFDPSVTRINVIDLQIANYKYVQVAK